MRPTSLNSFTNRSKVRCCARRLAAGGCAVSCSSVRCIRSCRPFRAGCPASIRSGTIPNLIHHTARRDNPASARDANGAPFSVRIASGSPYSRNPASRSPAPAPCPSSPPSGSAANNGCGHRHRQRINSLSVSGPEPALEVGAPHPILSIGMGQRLAIWCRPQSLLAG